SSSSSSSDSEVRDNFITKLKNQLAEDLREKDDLKLKLEKFKTSSKKLTDLLNSQISVNDKIGIGFDSQMTKNELHDIHKNNSEVFVSASDIIPPPYTGNYMPSRPDLSFAGLDDSVYKTNVSETITSVPRNESTTSKSSKDSLEQPKDVRPSALIIEEWESDCDDDCRVIGQREVRPVWNNAQRVNHQNKLTHPHPKRYFVSSAVLTKFGNVPVNTAKQSSSRATISNSTARYVNTVVSRPTMNGAKPSLDVFHKSHSLVKRTIYQRIAPKNSVFKEKVNTAKVNNVTTAGTKAVVSAVQGHEENVVKSSACSILRPTGKVIDHISKDSRSYMHKRFDYVDPQGRLNRCSRHMTGNKSYLIDYQDIDGGFVALLEVLKEVKLLEKIRYALTVNPTIYTSCIEQLWATAKLKTVNGERQLQALVDKKKVIIIETSIISDLKLEDAGGTDCLPTATIIEELARKKSRRKQRKDNAPIEPTAKETPDKAHVSTPSYDPSQSGEDRMQLHELMNLYTKLSDRVLALEIESLKRRVKSLEKRKKSRTLGFKRLRKVGSASRVESSNDASLGAQEDASKQGRKIAYLDADVEVTLVDETQDMNDDNLMFNTGVLEEQEKDVVEKEVSVTDPVTTAGEVVTTADEVVTTANIEVTTVNAPTTTIDELTLAQTLIEIKAAKPKAVTSAATITITTRPKARGVILQEPSEFKTTSSSLQASQLPQAKDKGKGIMVEPEVPLKKKDQVALDEEMARNLKAQLQVELIEEERIARQKEEEANIALLESWDNTQAMMDADF
ncbi:hypothetical protein Tco_0709657, partial [Tanacetum coccineum]